MDPFDSSSEDDDFITGVFYSYYFDELDDDNESAVLQIRAAAINRNREGAHRRLYRDYFADESVYDSAKNFRNQEGRCELKVNMNMQSLHHQQQQLAALLSVALPKDKDSSSSSSQHNNPSSEAGEDDASRLAAINSLHRAILYPHNSLLVTHSASFLAQGFSQLLADKSYSVRQAAATAYGALCAVLCSLPSGPNGRQNHVILGNLVDRFIGWALPLFSNVNAGDGTVEIAAEGLHELLNVADIVATDRYALPILKACQDLLEDERTSLSLLHRLLTILTLISLKFFICFQAHFVDIVDLLLGWAMIPDLAESDRSVIMDSFLQFQKHWVNNLQFSLGLLSKFLGDMDVLLQDGSFGTPQQRQRLLALLSCFSTVLQSTASGLLEINLLEEIKDPLTKMLPQLLQCLSMVGRKYGWSKWIVDSWKCLTLLAEILSERFSSFYSVAVDILFQSLDTRNTAKSLTTEKLTSFQVHGVLKTNLQLLSLQKLGLLPSSVNKILQFNSPVSQLRLHPNHLVTSSSAATYVFLLQHGNNEVVECAMASLLEELNMLKNMLAGILAPKVFSKTELFALFKFDMKVLLSCVSLGGGSSLIGQPEIDTLYVNRSNKMIYHIIDNLNPFESPIQEYIQLQVAIFKMLNRLSIVEFLSKFSMRKHTNVMMLEHFRKYSQLLIKALDVSSPLSVKLEALQWIHTYCETVKRMHDKSKRTDNPSEGITHLDFFGEIVFSVLDAASDREPKVRCQVALVLETFLHSKLIHPSQFYTLTEVILEKLGDPDEEIKELFLKLLSHALPITVLVSGIHDDVAVTKHSRPVMQWKQIFALRQLPHQLHSKQLVSILSYISQRWKVPLSSWIHRLIHTCHSSKDFPLVQEDTGNLHVSSLFLDMSIDEDVLERTCSVNLIAGVWWAIHEATRYCITTRLRTNLGGPSQTFAALERMLLDVPHVLQANTDQSDASLNLLGSSYSYAHLLPLRLLLDFVESLKKNVYNAYDGSTVLPSPSRQSFVFFKANKKVCEEWFSRICEPMMNAGLALQCHDATIHYCGLRLQELKSLLASSLKEKSRTQVMENLHSIKSRFLGDVLRVLRVMTLSLCKNHEVEDLIGLQKWVSSAFFPLFFEENQSLNGIGSLSWITGLVYQAQGQYEKAAAHFTHLLQTEESLASMGSEGVQFAITRIIESYNAVSDWKSLESWLSELQLLRSKHAGKSYSGALTMAGNELNYVHALAHFDDGDYTSAWGCLDLTPKSSNELALDPKVALQRSEQMLLQAMLFNTEGKVEKVENELQKAKSMLNETFTILPLDGLTEAAEHVHQLHCVSAFEESCKISSTQEDILSSYIQEIRFPSHHIYQDCKPWMKILRVYRTVCSTSPVTLNLSLNLLHLARKQNNLMLANRLNEYLNKCQLSEEISHKSIFSSLQYENILLMHAENKLEEAYTGLWSLVSPFIVLPSSNPNIPSIDGGLKAKACLQLSKWLKKDRLDSNLENIILKILPNSNHSDDTKYPPRMDLIIEELVGTTTKLSTRLSPTMGKSWISYASWCYTQARATTDTALQSCSLSPVLDSELLPDRFRLTEEEVTRVKHVVSDLLNGVLQDSTNVDVVVDQVLNVIESAAENSGSALAVTSQLQKFFLFANIDVEGNSLLLNELVDVWWCLRKRRVSLYGHAASGFINYLSHSSSKLWGSQTESQKNASYTLKATLHVLHILLNYGVELKATLEPALSTVPLLPWQEVTPQLFARLSSHPEEDVRKQLEGILVMLAKESPWSIIYPTLVDINTSEEDPSMELTRILACLNKQYPRLVQDVQLMIKELENVTILWEELWLSTLQDLHSDVIGRINLLKEEASRISENTTLTHTEKNKINAAKYSAMMAPIIVTLERRLASTSRTPETPHEAWFHTEYMSQIQSAISTFKTPPSATSLAESWKPFDAIISSLSSYQRKPSVSLSEVAPHLSLLSSSDVPMPGQRGNIITIASFSNQLTILPTKTKPKKLLIVGSDGRKYPYLLKGREDLRLDARIMQLLQAINNFLHSSHISIRNYSVTPISGRAGLIQWVENVTSIYSVYKSWQNRVQVAQGKDSVGNVPRPTDVFYGKIIPALKEKGIRRVISRKDWPHDVKRKVLLDLMQETPKQILYQEMWCASEGFKAFRSKLKRYSGSVAAMSMVGHILGLGDRHLDNILLDFHTGDIVHIDYNVCFDKGQRLKVPEIVPFRLTQTLEAALGLMGTEGSFKKNCETILGILKKNKDVILMMLEVFVWDPLVEWTRGDFHDDAAIVGEERKGMELAVSLSLFASRVQEIRVPLQEHHDLLLATLPAVKSALQRFLDILTQYEIISSIYNHTDQERSNLILHETSAKATLTEATTTLEKTRTLHESHCQKFSQTKSSVSEKALEAATWIDQHSRIIEALRTNSIPEITTTPQITENSLSLTSAVLAAGVPFTVVPEPTQVQCHDIDTEVSQLVSDLHQSTTSCITSLQTYALSLQTILPLNYLTTSPVNTWAQVLSLSVNSISPDVLSIARRQAAELLANVHEDNGFKNIHNDLCVQVEKYGSEIERVEREYQELVSSIGVETESRAKNRLMDAVVNSNEENNLTVVRLAVGSVYNDIKVRLLELLSHPIGRADVAMSSLLLEFEEKVEKCVLVAGWLNEINQEKKEDYMDTNWGLIFKSSLISCKNLVTQMIEKVVPNIVQSVVSYDSELMDAFGSLSQIRGSIDTALEQLIEVQIERGSLMELEKSYFVKVGFITEQQLALEEAAVKSRDHLSWEEADELASQEEACRAQLDELHQTWNQKDIRMNCLLKKEASIRNMLISSENHFQMLISQDQETESRSKAILSALSQPFSELESVDKTLSSSDSLDSISQVTDLFFMWKVAVMDSFLDSCIRVSASSRDQNFDFDQILNTVKKTLSFQLQEHIGQYLKDKIAPRLLTTLSSQIEVLNQINNESDQRIDMNSVERVKKMVQEYCNAHETVRAGISSASLMKRKMKELKEGLHKTCLDIIQLEWMHDVTLTPSHTSRLISHKFLSDITNNNNNTLSVLLNLSRPRLLETIRSSVSKVVQTLDRLQSCEQSSLTAEGQLERAMGWACGGPNSGGLTGSNSGIPPEFHDHLAKRRNLLWSAREKASDVVKICMSILDFEASRDGVLGVDGSGGSGGGRGWQQVYFNALTSLDATYHSFTRSEHEWELAQREMEAASNGLLLASNELRVASGKAKSASGDLQETFVAMRDCAYDASMALSAFGSITRGHTALTSECGSMLEEVLAITKGLHDVHTLGKEASALHSSLMSDLSKANTILIPLESVLTKDVEAMTEAMNKERETKLEISPIHGQAIHHSYHTKIIDACHVITPLVPSLTFSVKGLHSMLTRLARTANIHAGNLHKALEGLGESQEIRSQDLNLPDDIDALSRSDTDCDEELPQKTGFGLDDKGWVSPPDSVYDASSADSTSNSNSLELTETHHDGHDSKENNDVGCSDSGELEDGSHGIGDSGVDGNVKDVAVSLSEMNIGVENIEIGTECEEALLEQEEIQKSPMQNVDVTGQVSRVKSKNAYAVSVLRRVEMKIEGRDITDNRDISIAEQVDYLLRQATNVDNLCNMYEGWTPWI
ncbi:hypothetical protein LXL04_017454 [Taraxacum kok-saghyz]